jgi:hypothetical protein
MSKLLDDLAGGDLRSIGNVNALVKKVRSQKQFDRLFEGLLSHDRLVVMRAADAVEKLSLRRQRFLEPHTRALLNLLQRAQEKELKWHLALLVSRVPLTQSELGIVWSILSRWALDTNESRIVRVNAVQGLFNLLPRSPRLSVDFELTIGELEKQEVPSLKARIRILRRLRAHF